MVMKKYTYNIILRNVSFSGDLTLLKLTEMSLIFMKK